LGSATERGDIGVKKFRDRRQCFNYIASFNKFVEQASFFVKEDLGAIAFGISLGSMGISLLLSLYEVSISIHALNIALSDMEKERHPVKRNLK
jgi:hypothetical protein